MAFKKGDRVAYQNGGALLFLEDHDGMGSGIKVLARDCQTPAWQQSGEKNGPI